MPWPRGWWCGERYLPCGFPSLRAVKHPACASQMKRAVRSARARFRKAHIPWFACDRYASLLRWKHAQLLSSFTLQCSFSFFYNPSWCSVRCIATFAAPSEWKVHVSLGCRPKHVRAMVEALPFRTRWRDFEPHFTFAHPQHTKPKAVKFHKVSAGGKPAPSIL